MLIPTSFWSLEEKERDEIVCEIAIMQVLNLISLLLLALWCPEPLLSGSAATVTSSVPKSSDVQIQAIREAAMLAAGIYKNATYSPPLAFSLDQTVVITACNSGYLPHLLNFDCYAQRLGIKYMMFALDVDLHRNLQSSYPHINSVLYSSEKISRSASYFRSRSFNLITSRKKEAVLCALTLGYDVLFIDVDIAVVQDPIPSLVLPRYDYVHSVNVRCSKNRNAFDYANKEHEGNTGLYFVRSNSRSVSIFKQSLQAARREPELDDQTIFWNTIRSMNSPQFFFTKQCLQHHVSSSDLKKEVIAWKGHDNPMSEMWLACPLDACSFSVGALHGRYGYSEMMRTAKLTNRSIHSVHANFVNGAFKKKLAMERHGFWILKGPLGGKQVCKDFFLLIPPEAPKGEIIVKAVAK